MDPKVTLRILLAIYYTLSEIKIYVMHKIVDNGVYIENALLLKRKVPPGALVSAIKIFFQHAQLCGTPYMCTKFG